MTERGRARGKVDKSNDRFPHVTRHEGYAHLSIYDRRVTRTKSVSRSGNYACSAHVTRTRYVLPGWFSDRLNPFSGGKRGSRWKRDGFRFGVMLTRFTSPRVASGRELSRRHFKPSVPPRVQRSIPDFFSFSFFLQNRQATCDDRTSLWFEIW